MGGTILLVLFVSVGLAATGFTSMTAQAGRETAAHRLSTAVSNAYEQWTLDDDQSNMYAAVVALRDPAQHSLAETTYGQAAQAYGRALSQLAVAAHLASSNAERTLLRRIRSDLASYNGYTLLMRREALAGNVQRAIHVVTVENLTPSNDLPVAFDALNNLTNAAVAQAN